MALFARLRQTTPIVAIAAGTVAVSLGLVGFDMAQAVGRSGELTDRNDPLPPTIRTPPGYTHPGDGPPPVPGDQVRRYVPELHPGEPERAPSENDIEGAAMTFALEEVGGRPTIVARGRMVSGTLDLLIAFDERHGETAEQVLLDSPGGVLVEAMAMGNYIRERGLDTLVEPDGLCASACPLAFAGGVARRADATSWIGVHRVYITQQGVGDTVEGLRRGQQLAAACMQHLEDLGVDPDAWRPALATPWNEMYFFTPEELDETGLATVLGS